MTIDHGLAPVLDRFNKLMANPEEVLLVLLRQGDARPQAGMYEDKVFCLMVAVQSLQKLSMGMRKRPLSALLITLEGFAAAIEQEHHWIFAVEVVKKHLFVIAAQKYRGWKILRKIDEVAYDSGAVGAAINVVTEENDLVFGVGLNLTEQGCELGSATMYVAYCQQALWSNRFAFCCHA